jgi:serine/threonine protein kinase
MSDLVCLGCKKEFDAAVDACPHCGERVTGFQKTYGTRLIDGKYQILQRLGVGGMGEIFKVRHIHLGEERVIKIMRANIAADEQSLQRFSQEARMATMIKHRNLAMLYDFSTLEDGSYYMVWEYIEGINIQKWIAENGPVPPRLALEIAIQALSGLASLHEMGIIHRDISPENIMLSQDFQNRLLVKVIDFGIAKQLSEGEASGQGLTQTGMFLGKLKYASPEQAGFLREGEHLDHRSDIYSFGVVFYEMLAGRAPFSATNPHGYILKHATEKPPSIAQMNPAVAVPPELEALVFRALEKDRATRFIDADEFAETLEQVRPLVPPDPKYGLGERLVTMTGRSTFGERPSRSGGITRPARPAMTPAATPVATPPPAVAETEEATVIEKPAAGTLGGQQTILDAVDDAQPTVAERVRGEAAVTLLEKSETALPSRRKNLAFLATAAAVLVVAAVSLMLYFGRPAASEPPLEGTVASTTIDADLALPAVPPQKAMLLLASPVGELMKIENSDTSESIPLTSEQRIAPTLLQLAPGNYVVTLRSGGEEQRIPVTLEASQTRQVVPSWKRGIDLDALAEEILRP